MSTNSMEQIYKNINNLNVKELTDLSEIITSKLEGKKARFKALVESLKVVLDTISTDYPNAVIPLIVSPNETIDIMDLIIPEDFIEKCKIGG